MGRYVNSSYCAALCNTAQHRMAMQTINLIEIATTNTNNTNSKCEIIKSF